MAQADTKRKPKKKKTLGDSDVVVMDSGAVPRGASALGIDVHHTGVGKNKGKISNVTPASFDDGTTQINLSNAVTLLVEFGNDRSLNWDAQSKKMTIDLGSHAHKGKSGAAAGDDDWILDGEQIQDIELTARDASGNEIGLTTPSVQFTIHLQ
jgi:hypothetical protein